MDGGRNSSPSHGIGVTPDMKTLWVTSIPNNAVYVYSLADLKLAGEVADLIAQAGGKRPTPVVVSESGASVYSASAIATRIR